MEMIIFIGIPATGKSSYYKKNFYDSHIRINLDMLKTRHREKVLSRACLESKQQFVIDNTNLTTELRKPYIDTVKEFGFKIIGYYFQSSVKVALEFNAKRENKVPDVAILSGHRKLELPKLQEGYDELYYVRHNEKGEFITEVYKNEV